MKYCKKCSKAYNDNEMYCEDCGEKLVDVVETQQPGNNNQYTNQYDYTVPPIASRGIAVSVVLSIVTCGIYGLYWFVKLTDEINIMTNKNGDTSGITALLLSIVTCGIYGIYWSYKMGEKVGYLKGDNQGSEKILFIVLAIFGLQIINYALIQDAINSKLPN